MEIRQRTERDLSRCVAMLKHVHGADQYPYHGPADPERWLTPEGSAMAWVAEDVTTGALLGHISVVCGEGSHILASIPGVAPDGVASVSRLFVSPAARGRGLSLGTSLLAHAQTWCDERELVLTLDVVEDGGQAVRLYDRLGWRLLDRLQADWLAPDGLRPMIRVYRSPRPEPVDEHSN